MEVEPAAPSRCTGRPSPAAPVPGPIPDGHGQLDDSHCRERDEQADHAHDLREGARSAEAAGENQPDESHRHSASDTNRSSVADQS
jgi:hypothetical protein